MARWVLAAGIGLGLAAPMTAVSQGMGGYGPGSMGGGMMGGGMMGGGMMGGYGAPGGETGQTNDRNATWDPLASYIGSNRLPCMSCHRFSGRAAAPAFLDIAQRFGGQPNAATELAGAISYGIAGRWQGYPPMPGGLATPGQAKRLASLILDLRP
jgi:cytochrome c